MPSLLTQLCVYQDGKSHSQSVLIRTFWNGLSTRAKGIKPELMLSYGCTWKQRFIKPIFVSHEMPNQSLKQTGRADATVEHSHLTGVFQGSTVFGLPLPAA